MAQRKPKDRSGNRIRVERSPTGVGTLTLNRPEVRNAFDDVSIGLIHDAFKVFSKDRSLRLVLLRGEGRDFCAGADLNWMKRAAHYPSAKNTADARKLEKMIRAIDECPVPVLTAVQGNCFGGGLGIVAASDIVVSAKNAVLCFSEVRIGILPAVVSTWVVPKIGAGQARRYFLTGERFDAVAARRMGLVHQVVEPEDLQDEVQAFVDDILRNSPQAIRAAKALIREIQFSPSTDKRVALATTALVKSRASSDAKEGFSAFLEKRKPRWLDS